MLLPITSVGIALRLQREHEIGGALQADPDRLRPREAVAFAVEETAEAGDHPHQGIERRRFGRWGLASGHQIDRLPFRVGEDRVTRHLGAVASEVGQKQHAPGDDHVEGQRRLQAFAGLQL